jgi:hypothetical protein
MEKQEQTTWVTNIYTPEGADRPDHNSPTSKHVTEEPDEPQRTVADIVSRINHGYRD